MAELASVAEAKRELRRTMRPVRGALAAAPDERARRSAVICAELITAVAAKSPTHVLLFDPLDGEPDVGALAAWCTASGIAVHLPVVVGAGLRTDPPLDPELLDVVVVPALAFTPSGDRLGQGGGHFDRFLAGVGDGCLRIGVAFREQLVDALPIEAHDVGVDAVIVA